MYILLTNDDGINARGLAALEKEISKIADTVIVAPYYEQSAAGHSITISDPLRIKKIDVNGNFFGYAVNGTPADCVKIAVHAILDKVPDMVISGINRGANIATNIIYSGTVSAATEGTIIGIPSIAFSLATFHKPDYSFAAQFARKLALTVHKKGLPQNVSLNVNIPAVPENNIKGVAITSQGKSKFTEVFHKRVDPKEHEYYWQGGAMTISEDNEDVDSIAISNNIISVTPIHYDLTNYEAIKEIAKWKIKF